MAAFCGKTFVNMYLRTKRNYSNIAKVKENKSLTLIRYLKCPKSTMLIAFLPDISSNVEHDPEFFMR